MAKRKYTPARTVRKIKQYLVSQKDFDDEIRRVCGDACVRLIQVDRKVIQDLIEETEGMQHG